jgi:predicted dehydrogenase
VAVAGCGYWGPNLVRNFSALPNCAVQLVCDADPARLAHMKAIYPSTETTLSYNYLVAEPEIDAVAIATPVYAHFAMAKEALSAGKHVFLEKPMAASVAECEELVDLAAKKGLVLMVGHTFLYSGPVRAIKEIVQSGELGRILYVSSRRLNLGLFQKDINVAWDLAPHDIAIILYILGQTPVSVSCQGKAHYTEGIEDVTTMTLSFEDGTFVMIQSSWLDPNKIREITVVGSNKMLVYDDIEPIEKVKIYDKRVELPPHYDTFDEFHYSYHYGDIHCPYIKQTEPLRVECQHFVDCILDGETPLSDGCNGLEVVRVLEASSRSLRDNGNQVALAMTTPAELPKESHKKVPRSV